MPDRSYRWVLWTLALLGLAADQASKYGVFAWLRDEHGGKQFVVWRPVPNQGFQIVTDFQRDPETGALKYRDNNLVPHVNHGALFGFLREHESLANNLFALISILAALAIAYWSMQESTARDLGLCASLGLILAGTLGNLYDRLMFDGVRDFLHWNYLFNWPVFNLADCFLVAGASLLLLQAFVHSPAKQSRPTPAPTEQPTVAAPPSREQRAVAG